MLYLAGLPLWEAMVLVVALPTLAAVCGQIIVRKSVGLEQLTTNNEIAGFKFATVGVIFAVIVAFAVIVVWEKFAEAQGVVAQEAGASATLYRLSASPDPKMKGTREALGKYLRLAVEKDWPAMGVGKSSPDVTDALNALYASVTRLAEGDTRQTALLIEMSSNSTKSRTPGARASILQAALFRPSYGSWSLPQPPSQLRLHSSSARRTSAHKY
jgi:hypothetical protein